MIYALAPMASLSHRPLRMLIQSFGGCDEYYSEMISARGMLGGGHLEAYYTDAGPDPSQVVYQLMGPDTASIVEAAERLNAKECLGIDINMGCAAPHIARQGCGISWMRDAVAAAAMVKAVRSVVTRRLSVKLRLGFGKEYEAALASLRDFCMGLCDAGIEQITLHPRGAKQKLKRRAQWSAVAFLQKELPVPVYGNGDVGDAAGLLARTAEGTKGGDGGWAGVMVGRAAVSQPWIFAQARGLAPESIDRQAVGLEFIRLLQEYQPQEFWRSRLHRFFEYYTSQLVWGHRLNTAIAQMTEPAQVQDALINYFLTHPEEKNIEFA